MAYNLLTESFAEYGIAVCFLLLRFFARIKVVGIRGLQLGDAFAFAAMIFYTLMTSGIYLLESFGNNIGLNTVTAMEVPDSEVRHLIIGSKLAFINWIWYLSFIWCLKGVLLDLYYRIGTGLARHENVVIAIGAGTFITWLACILTHVCICLPPSRSWQIKPYPGDNCTIRQPNYVVIAVLNCVTDFAIMVVPMPLLFKVQVSTGRKLILGMFFCSAIFVMVATILRAYYSLRSIADLPIALGWADREGFVATITVCLPGIKPLFSKRVWYPNSSKGATGQSASGYSSGFGGKMSSKNGVDTSDRSTLDPMDRYFEMVSTHTWRNHKPMGAQRLSKCESDEEVIISSDSQESKAQEDSADIFVTREYRVSTEEPREDSTVDAS